MKAIQIHSTLDNFNIIIYTILFMMITSPHAS